MARERRILIVGGGIAGLTLATALGRRGIAYELVERASSWPAVGAGIALQPNGMRALAALGLADDVERAGARIGSWSFCDREGQTLCETNLAALWNGVGPFIGITRPALHAALRAGVDPGACRLNVSIRSVMQTADEAVARFGDGSEQTYDLVVGCDGLRSTVRESVASVALTDGGQTVWRSISRMPSEQVTGLQFLLGDGTFFGLCPVGDGHVYGFANVSGPASDDPNDGRLTRLRQRFADYGPIVRAYLHALTADKDVHCSRIEWLSDVAWGAGRIVLAGDAAHASSPLLGQGGCLAIEDAAVLADVLDAAYDWAGVLPTFVARRRPRVEWVRQQSQAAGQHFAAPAQARNAALRQRGDRLMRERYGPLREPI